VGDFAEQVRDWQPFYSTVALAAATLSGLLFVSLSLRLDVIDLERPRTLRLARGSFGDFLYVLMLGLIFLVPHQAPVGLAVALFVLGGTRAAGLLRAMLPGGHAARGAAGRQPMREVALPAIASVGLLIVGAAVLAGQMVAAYGLVLVVAALLGTASWNAWLILVGHGDRQGNDSPM
jgi:hypothetical protein